MRSEVLSLALGYPLAIAGRAGQNRRFRRTGFQFKSLRFGTAKCPFRNALDSASSYARESSYTYDNLSRLHPASHLLLAWVTDNRTSKSDLYAGVTSNYSYDNIYELLVATQSGSATESYTYDPVGNRLSNLSGSGWSNNTSNELTAKLLEARPDSLQTGFETFGHTCWLRCETFERFLAGMLRGSGQNSRIISRRSHLNPTVSATWLQGLGTLWGVAVSVVPGARHARYCHRLSSLLTSLHDLLGARPSTRQLSDWRIRMVARARFEQRPSGYGGNFAGTANNSSR